MYIYTVFDEESKSEVENLPKPQENKKKSRFKCLRPIFYYFVLFFAIFPLFSWPGPGCGRCTTTPPPDALGVRLKLDLRPIQDLTVLFANPTFKL